MKVNAGVGSEQRVAGLDAIRGVAILLVVVSHARVGLMPFGGPVGVTLFFVLSGFLITRVIVRKLDQGTFTLLGFFERRARRLLPGLITLLVVVGAFLHFRGEGREFWSSVWPVAAYATNFRILDAGWDAIAPFGYLWSLAVEEHFYLIWPFALLACPKQARVRVILLSLAVLGAWRLWLLANVTDWNRVYLGSDTNAFALLAGAVLALDNLPRPKPLLAVSSLAAIIGLAAMGVGAMASVLLSTVGVLACAIVVLMASKGWALVEYSWLIWFGLISYELYLWQGAILGRLPSLLAMPLSAVVAFLAWKYVDRPFLEGQRRFEAAGGQMSGFDPLTIREGALRRDYDNG